MDIVEKSVSIVNVAFDQWIIDENLDIFNQYKVIDALNVCLDDCISNGDDTPAFYKDTISIDDINDVMHYISDRWNCSGRIRFILRVIDSP